MKKPLFKIAQPPRHPRNKWALIAIAGILVAGLLATGGYYIYRKQQNQAKQAAEKTAAEAQTESAKKNADIKSSEETTNNLPPNSTSISSEQVPIDSRLAIQITSFGQSSGMVSAAAMIKGSTDLGTCVISYKNPDDKPIVRQVNATKDGSAQNCSASVPEVEFGKLGTWQLSIVFYNSSGKVEASRDVTIN